MGTDAGSRKGPKSDINITPYIDILLVLLIIFMVVTPVRQMKLEARAPQPPPPEPTIAARPDVIVVSIGESAQIAINRVPTEINSLGSKLQEIYSARRNKDMFISASPKLPYGDVVRVIDISKGAGVGNIGLLDERMR
jgi:biopolymer transport protein TolR